MTVAAIDRVMAVRRPTMAVAVTTTDDDRATFVCRVARGDNGMALPTRRAKVSACVAAMDVATCDAVGAVRANKRVTAATMATVTAAPRTGLLPVETKADDGAAMNRARVEVTNRPCVLVDAREMDAARARDPTRVATAEIVVETDTARARAVAAVLVTVGMTDTSGARA